MLSSQRYFIERSQSTNTYLGGFKVSQRACAHLSREIWMAAHLETPNGMPALPEHLRLIGKARNRRATECAEAGHLIVVVDDSDLTSTVDGSRPAARRSVEDR